MSKLSDEMKALAERAHYFATLREISARVSALCAEVEKLEGLLHEAASALEVAAIAARMCSTKDYVAAADMAREIREALQ